MVESDSAPQFTSNYISTTTRPVVLAGARRASRNPPPPSPSISPTIASFTHVISESYDLPSDHYWNSELNQSSPTDLEASFEPPKNQPILKWNALCVQVLLYPITIVIYLLIGAAIFTAIERDNEKTMRQNVASQEMQRVDELQKAIEAVLRQHDISENISEEILSILCTSNSEIQNAPLQWEFLPAFYFAASVISTIGYGTVSPRTDLGRAFLCIYAVMGIPLLLVCLATIGKYLSNTLDRVMLRIPNKKFVVSKYKDVYSVGILIVVAFIIVILIPAIIFQKVEPHWSYKDAIYFAIVSLTTIGLGDLVPSARHLNQAQYVVLYVTWLFAGFAIVSVLVTKLSEIYTRVNKSIIVLSKRCFNKCLKVKRHNHVLTYENN